MSESGKVVVTKSKLDGLANAINDKAKSPGPKTIAQLTQTVNDMQTDAPVTSVNGKTGDVVLSATDVSAIPSTLTGTVGQVLTKTADGQEWKDETPRDMFFHVNGTLQNQDLVIMDVPRLSQLTSILNNIVLNNSGDFENVNTPMSCINVRYNDDSESTIILRYAGIGATVEQAIFSGIYYNASDELQYSVSLLYQLGEQEFQQYNIIPVRNIDSSTITPLAPTEAGFIGISDMYARGDHSHPKELPNVTTADNGKFLRVVNGKWVAMAIANANGGSF